jgi:ankyrin repeat protein
MLNATAKDGWTALSVAAKRGHTEVVKLLLDQGADAALKVKNIYTPFNYAVLNGRKEAAELLLSLGPKNEMMVKAQCPECGSKRQLLLDAPLLESDRQTRKILRCTVCGAIWSKRKIEWRASLSGVFAISFASFYGIYGFHNHHGTEFFHIALGALWTWIGIRHFTKSSKRAHTWIQGASQSAATD